MTYYHGTPKAHKVGEILEPDESKRSVMFTTELDRAIRCAGPSGFVYQVEPQAIVYRNWNRKGTVLACRRAKIIAVRSV